MQKRLRIAIFDYQVVRTNPIGGCHRRLLSGLASEHDFTVFAVEFDNPCPERIKWVRIPAPLRPLPLLFVAYHLLAPIVYSVHRLRGCPRFDLIQTVESKLSFGDVAYSHFCHTSYLNNHWAATQSSGFRGFSRWLDHRLHALAELHIYQTVKHVLVPSKGLGLELASEFPVAASKLRVLPNAIETGSLKKPADFDRNLVRSSLGIGPLDVVFVFAALGHFERKGLPLLMQALSHLKSPAARLLVVGGTSDLVSEYRSKALHLGLTNRVVFTGLKPDIKPYLWAADAFVIASTYETFSLVAFEAAAASLPLITPLLHGVEEIVRDRETGFVVRRTEQDFAAAMQRFLELTEEERAQMGRRARESALSYDEPRFLNNWRRFYDAWVTDATGNDIAASTSCIEAV